MKNNYLCAKYSFANEKFRFFVKIFSYGRKIRIAKKI